MQKKIHVIDATSATGYEIRKVNSKETFIIADTFTKEHGQVRTGLLFTTDIERDHAKKMLEIVGDQETGKFFFAYMPLKNLDACESHQNMGLSFDKADRYLKMVLSLTGLEDFIFEEKMKYKLAA